MSEEQTEVEELDLHLSDDEEEDLIIKNEKKEVCLDKIPQTK